MRCSSRILYCIVLFHCCSKWFVSSALPFGSRHKQKATRDEDDATTEQDSTTSNTAYDEETVTTTVRGAAKKVAIQQQQHNNDKAEELAQLSSTVTAFFQHAEDTSADAASSALHSHIARVATSSGMHEFLETTRRSLHRAPELMYELPHTSSTIQAILDELHITYTTGWAKNTHPELYDGPGGYGIVAHIGTQDPTQPCIILRADMDALPIVETTEDIASYTSRTPGKMHACGHDGHTTMLLGAAAILKQIEEQITVGTIRLVFQPAEEGGAGMKRMIEEGVVSMAPRARHGFGMHVWPTLPSGTIASKPGPLMAAAEVFEVTLVGQGGHAAMPHLTIDPIVAASTLITNLQSVISRTISPLESGVISVTKVSAGNSFNVIPSSATLCGTIRALSTPMLVTLKARLLQMVNSTATMHGLTNTTVQFMPDFYPPLINDHALFDWSQKVAGLVSPEGVLRSDIEPTMGGEDFAFLAETIPSMFFFLGQGSGGDAQQHLPRTDFGLHHPSFALDEAVMPIGVQLHVNVALRSLEKLAHDGGEEASARADL